MICEAASIPDGHGIDADVCIIGGGPAGLTVAKSLLGKRSRVVVLESGGLKFERAAQSMSRGDTAGDPYEPLDLCRIRQYGGSTGRSGWGGLCRDLEREDFSPLRGMPLRGWPLDHSEVKPYVALAAENLGLPAEDSCTDGPKLLSGSTNLFSDACILAPQRHFARGWRASFSTDEHLSLILHATALKLQPNEARNKVVSVQVAGRGSRRFAVRARLFVIAGGGIENARLLLLSDGLGNQNDLVGRCFMEHPRATWGQLTLVGDHQNITPYDPTSAGLGTGSFGGEVARRYFGIAIRPEMRAQYGILGSRTWIRPSFGGTRNEGGEALRYLSFWVRRGRFHPTLFRQVQKMAERPIETSRAAFLRLQRRWAQQNNYCFETILEQDPQPSNRVTLGRSLDRFDLPRAHLEWKVGPLVQKTLRKVRELISHELAQLGLDCKDTSPGEAPRFSGARHHMGTTRMSHDPKTGVVDADCRIHGTSNVFVAGSSVFPTGGNDMPTLTIIALSARLGAHLQMLLPL